MSSQDAGPREWLTPARAGLVGCGIALEAWALAAHVTLPGADLPRHVALTLGAWAIWVLAIWLVLSLPARHVRRDLTMILGLAAVLRLTLLLTPPSLSDDVYRAVWDARLVHAGINPYQAPPAAPELARYRDEEIWPRINHKEQRTPYPPVAELLGAAAYALAPERLGTMQALAALLDLASAGTLAWVLARIGLDPRRSLVVAWSPLGALHFAHSGHNDAAMVLLLVGGAAFIAVGRMWLAQVALGLATMAKWVPLLAVPAFARATGLVPVFAWAMVCALLTLPVLGAERAALIGVMEEAGGQRFNESSLLLVERLVGLVAPALFPVTASAFPAVVLLVAMAASWRWGEPTARGALVGGSRVLAVYLLVAPVVEPWYVTWLAPLIAVVVCRGRRLPFGANDALAWLWLTGMVTLTELTYPAGGSALWPAIRLTEYVPVYVGLLIAFLLRTRVANPQQATPM